MPFAAGKVQSQPHAITRSTYCEHRLAAVLVLHLLTLLHELAHHERETVRSDSVAQRHRGRVPGRVERHFLRGRQHKRETESNHSMAHDITTMQRPPALLYLLILTEALVGIDHSNERAELIQLQQILRVEEAAVVRSLRRHGLLDTE